MIQLRAADGDIRVAAAEKVRVEPHFNGDEQARKEFTVSVLKQKIAEGKFRGKSVVSCLPNDKLTITSLRVAEAEADAVERTLRKEVAQRFGMNPEKDTINYLVAGTVRQGEEIKNELILFAAEGEAVRRHIEMLEEARLRPIGIDVVPCALFRSFKRTLRRQEDSERTVVFADVGSRFTTVVFGHGRAISFVKQIPIGGKNFNEEIAARLDMETGEADILRGNLQRERRAEQAGIRDCLTEETEANGKRAGSVDLQTRQVIVDGINSVCEELTREISRCLRYHTVTFRGKAAERLVVTGGGAYENTLLDILSRQLPVEVEVAEPLKAFETASADDIDRGPQHCEWAVAVGLGLRGWEGEPPVIESGAAREEFTDKRDSNERD
jgi:type IV pilus assembly protein PilM